MKKEMMEFSKNKNPLKSIRAHTPTPVLAPAPAPALALAPVAAPISIMPPPSPRRRNLREEFAELEAQEADARKFSVWMPRTAAQETDEEDEVSDSSAPDSKPASEADAITVPKYKSLQLGAGERFSQQERLTENIHELFLLGNNLDEIPDAVSFLAFIEKAHNLRKLVVIGEQPQLFNEVLEFFQSLCPWIQKANCLEEILFYSLDGVFTLSMVQGLEQAKQNRLPGSLPLVISLKTCCLTPQASSFYLNAQSLLLQSLLTVPAVVDLLASGAVRPTLMLEDVSCISEGKPLSQQQVRSPVRQAAFSVVSFSVSEAGSAPSTPVFSMSELRRPSVIPSIYTSVRAERSAQVTEEHATQTVEEKQAKCCCML
ncbi:MAG: hypothetical protein K0S08_1193 [Gammaproteobacteria bacterium]|jgi:hypothetical protein|nr:hypothetical protein [Gammaproteobacteria bacterium]